MSGKQIADLIAKLRLQNPKLDTKRLLDQSEQLLALGREIEAEALVERAEALARSAPREDG